MEYLMKRNFFRSMLDNYGQPFEHNYNIIKYIIDNANNLDCEDCDNCRPIHLICGNCVPTEYSTISAEFRKEDFIKRIVDKDVNLECEDKFGSRPIHFLLRHNINYRHYLSHRTIKYFINKVDIECKNNDGMTPLHYACSNGLLLPKTIKYIIDKGVNLECEDSKGNRPIYYLIELVKKDTSVLLKSELLKLIKYLINKGINLEGINLDGIDIDGKGEHVYTLDDKKNMINKLLKAVGFNNINDTNQIELIT
jgi:ankyrin repeat protein